MRVAVIGAGGVGGFIAHRLAAAGVAVSVLARGAHLAAIRAQGLTLVAADGAVSTEPVAAAERGDALGAADLAVFAVKGQDMASAIEAARPVLADGGHALSLLNGVDGPGMLADAFGRARALIGIARISAFIEAPGRIRTATPWARFTVGDMEGGQDRAPVPEIRAAFQAAGLDMPESADVRADLWAKFVQLTALAAATAGARTDIGTVRSVPELAALVETLVEEALAVARAHGIALPEDTGARTMRSFETLPHGMRASLAHDLAAGKRLETDWLSGAVVRLGREAGVPTPAHRTVAALLAPYRDGAPPA